jgi:hypothetical protein
MAWEDKNRLDKWGNVAMLPNWSSITLLSQTLTRGQLTLTARHSQIVDVSSLGLGGLVTWVSLVHGGRDISILSPWWIHVRSITKNKNKLMQLLLFLIKNESYKTHARICVLPTNSSCILLSPFRNTSGMHVRCYGIINTTVSSRAFSAGQPIMQSISSLYVASSSCVSSLELRYMTNWFDGI